MFLHIRAALYIRYIVLAIKIGAYKESKNNTPPPHAHLHHTAKQSAKNTTKTVAGTVFAYIFPLINPEP